MQPSHKPTKLGISLDKATVEHRVHQNRVWKNNVRCRGVSVYTELYLGRAVENNNAWLRVVETKKKKDASRSVRAGFTCRRVSSLQQRTLFRPGLGQLLHHFFWKVFPQIITDKKRKHQSLFSLLLSTPTLLFLYSKRGGDVMGGNRKPAAIGHALFSVVSPLLIPH